MNSKVRLLFLPKIFSFMKIKAINLIAEEVHILSTQELHTKRLGFSMFELYYFPTNKFFEILFFGENIFFFENRSRKLGCDNHPDIKKRIFFKKVRI